jgi:hypothetical protein
MVQPTCSGDVPLDLAPSRAGLFCGRVLAPDGRGAALYQKRKRSAAAVGEMEAAPD